MGLNLNTNRYLALSTALTAVDEALAFVENTLEKEPVTDQLRKQLLEKLDRVSNDLSSLEKTALGVNQFAKSYFEQLREKAVELYGEVDNLYLHHEIVVLQDETTLLSDTLEKENFQLIALRIAELKEHLAKILDEFRPDFEERRPLISAKLILEKAEALLKGETVSEIPLTEWSLLQTEEILEEIAEYLSEDNRPALRALMQRLSPVQKRLVSAYLEPEDLLSQFLHDLGDLKIL